MNVTFATVADISTVVEFSKSLHRMTRYGIFEFDENKVRKLYYDAITGDPRHGIVLLSKQNKKTVGLLGAVVVQPTFSNELLGSEWVWWVDPTVSDYRKRLIELLDGYEYWAKNVAKCKAITVGRIENFEDPLGYFKRRGYRLSEEAYIKELV